MEPNHQIVRDGYDVIGVSYHQRRELREQANIEWLDGLAEYLPTNGVAIDLGCGSGVPITRYFADRDFEITGFDLSPKMVDLARQNVPNARIEVSSIEDIALPAESVDLIVSFYAIIHIDRAKHEEIFNAVYTWLKPGGTILMTLGASDNPHEFSADWGGAPMVWSHFDADTNLALLKQSGFEVIWHEIDEMPTETFLNVIARKPV